MPLLLELSDSGSWVFDNTRKLAYVVGPEGDAVFRIEKPRVIVPRTDLVDDATSKDRIEGTLWAVMDNRKEVPSVTPDQALEALRVQVELVRLCFKPGGLAEKAAKEMGLPCLTTDFKSQTDDILMGLPHEETLGYHLRDRSGTEGIVVFPDQVAAVRIVEGT